MKNIVEYIQEHVFEHPQMMSNIYENYNVVKMYFEDKDIPDFCNELLTQNYSASYVINEYLKSVNTTKTIERIKNDLSSNILSIKSDNNMIYRHTLHCLYKNQYCLVVLFSTPLYYCHF